LQRAGAANRVSICLRARVGEHVVAGSTLAWMWSSAPDVPMPRPDDFAVILGSAVRIGFERTLEQDPGFGLRQLIDTACKALSPAVNDPYTAIQAIDHLSVLFAALAARPLGDFVVMTGSPDATTSDGAITVAVPARSFAEHLELGVGLIRRYGASEPTVIQALLRLLATALTATGVNPDRWAVIENQAQLLVADAERAVVQPADLAVVYAEAESLRTSLAARGTTRRVGDEVLPTSPPPM
jgi:uncharacterized membrane protein